MEEAAFNPKEFISLETPIHKVDARDAWEALNENQKAYAYHFAQASWEGYRICLFQKSWESPGLYLIFRIIFKTVNITEYHNLVIQNGFTEREWKQFVAYIALVLNNAGNYKSFGDSKFVPQINKDKFWVLLTISPNFLSHSEIIKEIWVIIGNILWKETPPYKALGFKDEDGTTTYYSANIERKDAEFIKEFMEKNKLYFENTRLFKTADGGFQIKVASAETEVEITTYEGVTIEIVKGDYSPIMRRISQYLERCIPSAKNDIQRDMIKHYSAHFLTGDIEEHRDSQRLWITDINPVIETNIGFIESYVDPLGVRAEFEGWVALTDPVDSQKFTNLVAHADELIALLPWGKHFEKTNFKKPNFISLKILAYGSSGIPLGICIPNYDDIRDKDGYKNVNLANMYPVPKKENAKFLEESILEIYLSQYSNALKLKVALHELLGHGSGKLLMKDTTTGELNFDPDTKNPFTGEPVTYYLSGQSFQSKFGFISSAFEECKAESVALYLSLIPESLEIFFPEYKDKSSVWEDIVYICWLDMIHAGLKGLEYYNPEKDSWGQAHVTARYVILQVLLEAGDGLVTITTDYGPSEDNPILKLALDREKIFTTGKQAITTFLHKLNVYKAIGDAETGAAFFKKYMEVDDRFFEIRDIVIKQKRPRRAELQPNILKGEFGYTYEDYEETFEGIIMSFANRFEDSKPIDQVVYDLWMKENQFTKPF